MISAEEAYRIGLINEIVPAAELISRAEAILKKIAANAPIAVKLALEAINKGMETSQSESGHCPRLMAVSTFSTARELPAPHLRSHWRQSGATKSRLPDCGHTDLRCFKA
jgi:enoyl-CoA hydratase/carnithine racemase